MPEVDVVLLGEYFFDLIFAGLPEMPALGREIHSGGIVSTGGAMFITACSLARLEVRHAWPATFGSDAYSQFVRSLALREGVDLSLAREVNSPFRRVTTAMPLSGERAFVTFADPVPGDCYDYWLDQLLNARFRHIHFGGLEQQEDVGPLIALAHDRGATVSMDCYDTPLFGDPSCDWECLLYGVDIFFPNAREARLIAREDDLVRAVERLSQLVPTVIVKDGASGAWLGAGGHIAHIAACEVGDVVDTTGAGDCFNAGYLCGRFSLGLSETEAIRCGTICGGYSVTGIGGATNAPTRVQLVEQLAALAT